ncbi:MAG: shikimate kinase [Oscillospiraceae bacterium]|nr:shikimate kinase [Oscillospiraceae bacterium]MDD4368862.1 shikimate kinase [Oscillospiraceae bacterium]
MSAKYHKPRRRPRSYQAYVLIGMPSSGKSSLGRRIAKTLDCPFIDTDDVLAAREGCSVGELSQQCDFAEFVRREEAAVMSLKPCRAVIATGGSVVYGARAMRHLKRFATIIYLDVPLPQLRRRVGDLASRGVILPAGYSFADLYRERSKLYKRYNDITYRTNRLSPRLSAACLAALLRFIEAQCPRGPVPGSDQH